jgi:hypothetical protein
MVSLLVLANAVSPGCGTVAAQEATSRPIDMMLVIDNSCSMFPKERRISCCEVWGNDPDFLRITGAYLFAARLGFAETNEKEYQAGVISLGEAPKLISPLQPLAVARGALAKAVANPEPACETRIIPALNLAYKELLESPKHRPTNLPAVVLITDGIPYPASGQSNADIEQLVSSHPDVPFFAMLLQNRADPSAEYEKYISFWQDMQGKHSNVFAYRIQDAKQIEETYNIIVAQLQNTVSAKGTVVDPGTPLEVFVSRYVQKIVATVIHRNPGSKGMVTIKDPGNKIVLDTEPGVSHFRDPANPVEVISVAKPRLRDDQKDEVWTLISDESVIVFLDRQGAYRINFLLPPVSLTDVTNVYQATERQPPNREFAIRFNLLDGAGKVITEPQPIQGKVTYPNAVADILRIPSDLKPDDKGVYEYRYNFASEYPAVLSAPGRFTFVLNAGVADERSAERVPITSARLLVDVGRGPYIGEVAPDPIVCAPDKPPAITVKVADYETAQSGSIGLRIFGDSQQAMLKQSTPGLFNGDLKDVCAPLLARLACSTQQETTFRLRLVAQLSDGGVLHPVERPIKAQLVALACTPTPRPSPTATLRPTATPTPSPTPVPDTDVDGKNDLQDRCVDQAEWPFAPWFGGCPPPWVLLALAALILAALLAFIVLWLIPWISVRVSPPPRGYVLVCRPDERVPTAKSVQSAGLARRARRVTIGGDAKRAHIYVRGLKPVEFVVVKQNDRIVLLDAQTGTSKGIFDDRTSTIVSTSNGEITLRICQDQSRLRC